MKRLVNIIKQEKGSIMKDITMEGDTLTSPVLVPYRTGHPRTNWLVTTLNNYWLRVITLFRPDLSDKYRINEPFNEKDSNQKKELLEAVKEGFNGFEIPGTYQCQEVEQENVEEEDINWLKAHPTEVPNTKQIDKEKGTYETEAWTYIEGKGLLKCKWRYTGKRKGEYGRI